MKEQTPSFTTEIPLKVTPSQESALNKRFEAARQVYNACLSEALKRLRLMRESKEWGIARELPKGAARTKEFRRIDEVYGFRKYDLQKYAQQFGHSWLGFHLDSQTVKALSDRAFTWVKEYAFDSKRGKPKFKRYQSLNSVQSLTNSQGIMWRDSKVVWNSGRSGKKLILESIIDSDNPVINHGLAHRVKFVRLVRRQLKDKTRFYAQLVNEGLPLKRFKMGKGIVGLDIGPSTIAGVGSDEAFLKQFCQELEDKQKEARLLQRHLDRQRRTNNPDNYNPNGTIKSGVKLRWIKSNRQQQTETKIAELKRKEAAHRKSLHGQLINKILQMGDTVKLEKLYYVAFQKMWGKSVGKRAPGAFVAGLKAKMGDYGGLVDEFSTYNTKLSQLCHGCGQYVKKPLSKRWHKCECGVEGQRDLYSAFLATCIEDGKFNATIANKQWYGVGQLLQAALNDVKELRESGATTPSSFG